MIKDRTDPRAIDHEAIAASLLRDHPPLGEKIAAACDLSPEDSERMLVEVLRFLSLIAWSGRKLTPPRTLDLAWHELILFTRVYAACCERFHGRFIHHQPGGSDEENGRQLRSTLKLYGLFFGSPDPRFWGDHGYWTTTPACGSCEAIAIEQGATR